MNFSHMDLYMFVFLQKHTPPSQPSALPHSHGQTRGKAPHNGHGDTSAVMWTDIIDPLYLMIKTSERGAVTGVSVRREGECISGWDRLRDSRGDSKGYWLSRPGCVADIIISHVYTVDIQYVIRRPCCCLAHRGGPKSL